jgi:hypothetical protein
MWMRCVLETRNLWVELDYIILLSLAERRATENAAIQLGIWGSDLIQLPRAILTHCTG